MKTPEREEEKDSQEKNIFNNITIEKDKKTYKLSISKIDKEIIIKCRVEKPLKVFEKKFSKTDLEKEKFSKDVIISKKPMFI